MTTGEKIRDLRKRQGLSQEALAGQLGLSRQAVSRWENENILPETETVLRLSALFQVSTDYLLKEEVETPEARPDDVAPPRRSRRLLTGLWGLGAAGLLLVGVLLLRLLRPELCLGPDGEVLPAWSLAFWTKGELLPLTILLAATLFVGLWQTGRWYFTEYQPPDPAEGRNKNT